VDASRFLTFDAFVFRLAGLPPPKQDTLHQENALALEVALGGVSARSQSARAGEELRRSALALLDEMAGAGIAPEAFALAADALPDPHRSRARWAAALYKRFVEEEAGLGPVVMAARRRLEEKGLPRGLVDAERIGLSITEPLSSQGLRLVVALAHACERAQVRLELEVAATGDPVVDAPLETLFSTLERQAQALNQVDLVRWAGPAGEGPWTEVASRSMGANGPVQEEPAPTPLEIIWARSPSDEADQVARAVHARLLRVGDPATIAVGLFDTSPSEEARLAGALVRRGIPLQRPLETLGASPLGQRALTLLSLQEEGFPTAQMADLLPPETAEAPAAATLLLEAGIRDDHWGAPRGQNAYGTRLKALAERLRQKRRRERAEAVETLWRRAEVLMADVRALPQEASFSVFLEHTRTLVHRHAVRVGEESVLRVLDASLEGALQHARRRKRPPVTRQRFHGWLALLWSGTRLPGNSYGVELLDARRLAGRRIEHLFLVGLEEGRLPERQGLPSLLEDETRALVNRANGSPLFTVWLGEERDRAQLARDRLGWVQALGAAHASLTLSFAGAGWGGEAQAPSSWLAALLRQAGMALPAAPSPRLELEAAVSEEELRQSCARALRAGGRDAALAAAVRSQLGAESWLLEAEELARVEQQRLRFFSSPNAQVAAYTGEVPLTAGLLEALRFGPEHPLSASALSRWANCAFQGFLTGVLRLEPRELPQDDVDPRLRGAFWHLVLERLIPRLSPGVTEVPSALLEEALDESVQVLEGQGLICHPTLWALARESARRMVLRLVQQGVLFPFLPLRPEAVELHFGGRKAKAPWDRMTLPAGPGEEEVHLVGQIDRLDSGDEGLAVLDYKTGAVPSLAELERGLLVTEFQLPLYLYAARGVRHPEALRGGWLYVRSGELRTFEELLARTGQTLGGLLATGVDARAHAAQTARPNLANAVHGVLKPPRAGHFPARSASCEHCGLEAVCRISERWVEEAP
jgi:RecB family exonuclease